MSGNKANHPELDDPLATSEKQEKGSEQGAAEGNPGSGHIADYGGEEFDIVDDTNTVISRATRQKCHAEGLLHRSTHIFLFRTCKPLLSPLPRVEVLLQKRSEKKTVGPHLWDISVAEHLSAGEDYTEATVRGLKEEIGLGVDASDMVQIRDAYLSRQFYEDVGVLDHMFTCTFGMLYEHGRHGDVVVDGEEVAAVEWWPVTKLVKLAKTEPQLFTRWLRIELQNLNLVEVGKMFTGDM